MNSRFAFCIINVIAFCAFFSANANAQYYNNNGGGCQPYYDWNGNTHFSGVGCGMEVGGKIITAIINRKAQKDALNQQQADAQNTKDIINGAYAHEANMERLRQHGDLTNKVVDAAINPNVDLNRVQRALNMTNSGGPVKLRVTNALRNDGTYQDIGPATAVYIKTALGWQQIDAHSSNVVTADQEAFESGVTFRIGKPGGCQMSSNGLCIATPEAEDYTADAGGCEFTAGSGNISQASSDGIPLLVITYGLANACKSNGDPGATFANSNLGKKRSR